MMVKCHQTHRHKKPTDDFEQHSSKANDVLKDKVRPLDCPDGSLGKQAELKRTNRVAAWEENPDKEVNTHGSSDKNVNAEASDISAIEKMQDKAKQMSIEPETLKTRVPKTDTVEEIFTKAFAEEHNNHKNLKATSC